MPLYAFELFHFSRAQLAALPDCKPAYLEIAKSRAAELQHRMPYRFEHAADLAVLALMYDYLGQRRVAVVLQ